MLLLPVKLKTIAQTLGWDCDYSSELYNEGLRQWSPNVDENLLGVAVDRASVYDVASGPVGTR